MPSKSIKQASQEYQPKTAKNITELSSVSVDLVMELATGTDSATGEDYEYNFITVNGERYRVPDSVLSSLKAILEKKPSLKSFSVTKKGEGRQTKYTVIPMD